MYVSQSTKYNYYQSCLYNNVFQEMKNKLINKIAMYNCLKKLFPYYIIITFILKTS